jgi:hypothetical protein
MEDAFTSFDGVKQLNEKEIDKMRMDFGGRTAANGRIGTNRTKNIKAVIHWLMDFDRVSERPSIAGLSGRACKSQLKTAMTRAQVRSTLSSKNISDAADPGPLKSEKQWKEWEEKFSNYLRCISGALGVPLSYVIRDNTEPIPDGNYPDFVTKTIACAPLKGEYFDADKMTVFNYIVSFTTGQPSGDWIKNTLRFSDGRRSMAALRTHFAGEGNATRTIADADRLKDSLHYKSERAMSFENFLTQMQKMFNIYEKEGEAIHENEKLRLLFKKVQHKDLDSTIKALKAQQTAGTNITYTMAANHLSAAVSELPEYLAKNRTVAALGSITPGSGDGIYDADGNIKTGYISNWGSLSKEDRKKVTSERKRLGVKFNSKAGKDGAKSDSNLSKDKDNQIKMLKLQNLKQKRRIKSLTKVTFDDTADADGKSDDDADAGDQFGGKASKKKAKSKN